MANSRDVVLPIDVLRECFEADLETGQIRWRTRPADHFPSEAICRSWNARWAGKMAFTADNGKGYKTTVLTVLGAEWRLQAHRVVWALGNGEWPAGVVDHMDGDPSHNALRNLKDTDDAGNAKNARLSRRNTSGAVGVYHHKPSGRWMAAIGVGGGSKHLGCFDDRAGAVAARRAAQERLGFSTRHGGMA